MNKGVFQVSTIILLVAVVFLLFFENDVAFSPSDDNTQMSERLECINNCLDTWNACIATAIDAFCPSRYYPDQVGPCLKDLRESIERNCVHIRDFQTEVDDPVCPDDVWDNEGYEDWLEEHSGGNEGCEKTLKKYAKALCSTEKCEVDYNECLEGCDLQCPSGPDNYVFTVRGYYQDIRSAIGFGCEATADDRAATEQPAIDACMEHDIPHYECAAGCSPSEGTHTCRIISGPHMIAERIGNDCLIQGWAEAEGRGTYYCSVNDHSGAGGGFEGSGGL